MYVRVLQDELVFPDDRAIDQDTKSLIRGVSFSWLYAILVVTHLSDTASSTQSSPEDVRASHQAASVFLYDVRSVHIPVAFVH